MYTIYFMLYLIEILHQTTTPFEGFCPLSELYLIEILHQTTTSGLTRQIKRCCILSKFYIKPQLQMYTIYFTFRCILSKFYIKPQLQMYTIYFTFRCILSKFYIKPQRVHTSFENGLVVSYRNSTSNHNRVTINPRLRSVVSYRNSTSNHNVLVNAVSPVLVVSYRNSTSNHNLYEMFSL